MSIETPSTSTATVMKESLASISSLLIEKQKEKIKKQQLIKILEESMENLQFIQNSLEESYNLMNKNLKQIKESNTSSDEDVDDNGENVETLKSLCIVTKNRIKNIENICNKYEEIKSTKSNKNKKQNGKTGELNVNSNNENNENIPNKNVDCTILQSNKNTKETNIVNTELILDETNGEFHSIEKDKSMEKPQETDVMSDSEKENIKNEENVQNVKAKIRLVALEKLLDPNIIKNANERNKSQQITNEPIIIVDDSIVTIDDSNDDNSDDEEDLLPVSSFLPKSKTNSYSNNKINVNSDKKNTAVNEGKKKLIDKNKEKPNKEKFDDAVKEKSKTKNISSSSSSSSDLNDNHRSSDLINEHSVRKKSSRSCSSRNKISNSVHKINKCRVKIKKNSIFKYMIDNSVNQIRLAKLQILRDKISSNITTESTSTTTTSKKHQRQSKDDIAEKDNITNIHQEKKTAVNRNDEKIKIKEQSSSKSNSTTNKDKKSSEKNKKSSKKFGRIVKRRIMSDSDGSSDIEFENVANTNKTMAQGEKSANSSSQSTSSSSSSSSSSSEDEENSSAKVTDGGCTSMGGLKYKIFLKSNSKSDEQDDLVNDMNGDQNNGEYSGSSKSNERTNKKNKDSSDSEEDENEDEEDENNESSGESEILKRKRKKDHEMNDGDENKLKSNNDDNDILSENDEDDSDDEEKKGKKKRRKRIRPVSGSDSGSDKDSPNKKRKNIRKLLKTKELGSETKLAARQEEERRKRIEERQKIYNVYYEKPENVELKELVLDFDEKTKKPLLKVDEGLLKKLKPHQATGVKFMWDACFETIKDAKKKPGSGCILAHCMGLGKTLQVVTLVHTLLTNNDKTNVERVIVIAPLSTLNNWAREFVQWLKFCKNKNIEIYDMSKWKDKKTRIFKLNEWYEEGGVCILGYDMFRILTSVTGKNKKQREKLQKCLIDPGPDLVVCDEGHLLKNEKTSLSKAVTRMKTLRRIILTGTPLQNNLKEYYCMIQFIKPNLLGTYKEYMNRFVNPITNGQYTDSTEQDIRLMKHRSHVLHKLLEGCIQRRDYSVLAPYLPPKHEYVIFIQLSELQQKLYDLYMTSQKDLIGDQSGKGAKLFQDFCNLRRIWTHPLALKMNADITYKKKLEKALFIDEDEMGSLKDFIDDDEQSASNSSSDSESFNSDKSDLSTNKRGRSTRRTRQNADQSDEEPAEKVDERPPEWWNADCSDEALKDLYESPKLLLLMHILQECEKIGDKILLFSQSLQSLDVIEHFLSLIDRKTSGEEVDANLGSYEGSWTPGLDYFRLDGSRTVDNRDAMCKSFNNPNNLRARLFLISTRAGGLGINLVAANRVIIFDVSWNPSHDTQSIFRVYRFGQNKPCYIYRFIAMGTMEEKIYERQVTKQATAKRVLDEQQISRHYNQSDLLELYNYELKPNKPREIPILPKDRLFADILSEHEKIIYRYHEHDSLLENEESEHLSEEERKAAWDDFEAEKNRPAYQPYIRTNYGGMNGPVTSNRIFGFRSDILLRLLNMKISRDFPEMSEQEVYQHIPLYMNKLYHQIGKQDNTMYNELLELSSKLQVPPSGYFPYPMYQQQPTGMNMQHQSNAMNVQQVNAMNIQQPNAMNIQTAGGTQQNQNTYSLMTHNAQTRLIQQQQQKALQQLQQQKQKSNVASYSLPSTSSSEVYEID